MDPKGWRTLAKDLTYAICFLIIVVLVIFMNPPQGLWIVFASGALYGGQGYRDFLGKRTAGEQEVQRMQVAQVVQKAQIEAASERVAGEQQVAVAKAEAGT